MSSFNRLLEKYRKNSFSERDIGDRLEGDYWAIQCKCYQETSVIDKPTVASFLSTSSRKFSTDNSLSVDFSNRLWISTTAQAQKKHG